MIFILLSAILLTHTTLAQFLDSVKPDLRFTDNNDRFDISTMMRANDKMNSDTPLIDDDGAASDADFRRNLPNDDDDPAFEEILQQYLPDARRGDAIDLAYDPDNLPKIGRAGDDAMLDLEFQENLKAFAKNIPKSGRRNDNEGEVLMQNVVPIVLTVDGFLKAPLKERVADQA